MCVYVFVVTWLDWDEILFSFTRLGDLASIQMSRGGCLQDKRNVCAQDALTHFERICSWLYMRALLL